MQRESKMPAGRPPKGDEKQHRSVYVRFTDEEFQMLYDKAKSEGKKWATLIREMVLKELGA